MLRGIPPQKRSARRAIVASQKPRSRPLRIESLEDRCFLSGDPVLHWNTVAMNAAVVDHGVGAPGLQFGPTRTSRAFAIVQGAVYDAVNSIDPVAAPYLIQLSAPKGASLDAAVAEAAYTTLVSLYPYQKPYFDSELAASLQDIPTTPKIEGMAVGMTVANFILAARANDGSQIDAVGQPVNFAYPTARLLGNGGPIRFIRMPRHSRPTGERSLRSSFRARRSSAPRRRRRSPAWLTPRPTSKSRLWGPSTALYARAMRPTSATSGDTTPSRVSVPRSGFITRSPRRLPKRWGTRWSRTLASSRSSISPWRTPASLVGAINSPTNFGGR